MIVDVDLGILEPRANSIQFGCDIYCLSAVFGGRFKHLEMNVSVFESEYKGDPQIPGQLPMETDISVQRMHDAFQGISE